MQRERKEERIFLLISGGYGGKDYDGDDDDDDGGYAALQCSRTYCVAVPEGLHSNLHLRDSDYRGGQGEEILVTPMLIYSFGEAGLDTDLCAIMRL